MAKKELKDVVLGALKKRKASDVLLIDVKEKTSITDYFIIASARSTTQVKSLSEFIEQECKNKGYLAVRKEGVNDGRWAILDFGDVIAHIFNDETRLFYHLENLWGEGVKIDND